jgi:dynein heavy chain
MQLYESKVTRHGNMLVGLTLSGKTRAWEVLQDAMNQLNDEEKKSSDKNKMTKAAGFKYPAVKVDVINPKAINNDELFGYLDDQSPP